MHPAAFAKTTAKCFFVTCVVKRFCFSQNYISNDRASAHIPTTSPWDYMAVEMQLFAITNSNKNCCHDTSVYMRAELKQLAQLIYFILDHY